MKQLSFKTLLFGLAITAGVAFTSCKSKAKDTATSDTTTTMTTPEVQAPVVVNEDETMNTSITDAIKDYPGVKATAMNGVIMLSGEIQRSKLPDLMQSLNALKPKSIDNTKLTIK